MCPKTKKGLFIDCQTRYLQSFGSPIKLVGLISLLYELNDENVQVDVEDERSRRHAAFENSADAFSEDGVPVKNKKYAAYKKDGQGRVEIPRHMIIMIRLLKIRIRSPQ